MSVELFIAKAHQNFRDAQLLLASGGANSACSRAYYAMHDAARAALLAIGCNKEAHSKTHSGLIAQFNLKLVKPGTLSDATSRALSNASRSRIFADYDGVSLTDDVARQVVEDAERMVSEIATFIEQLP